MIMSARGAMLGTALLKLEAKGSRFKGVLKIGGEI